MMQQYDVETIDRLYATNAALVEALGLLDDVVNEPNGHPNGWNAALTEASDKARAALKLAKGSP